MKTSPLILFDGVCNLCNHSILFVIKRDKNKIFKYASLQSDIGKKVISDYHLSDNPLSSFILIENEKLYTKSTAALRVIKKLRGPVKLLYVFIIVPPFIRNLVYDIVAANRYKWFGKVEKCVIPGE